MNSVDEYVPWEMLGKASEAWLVADGAPGSPFDVYSGKFLPLPDWYNDSLSPMSPEYLAQQDRLWQLMAGTDSNYLPARDEQCGVDESNALVRPGFYASSIEDAGHHLIAMGHILRLCGLKPGDRVLEYGAGFGQIALALARLGVIVDTVDIDPGFCSAVNKQAKWFGVDLTAHDGQFGDNPTGHRYSMILFYEAFHHARNFPEVIERARDILEPGGKILMAAESVQPSSDAGFAKVCPYPWGMRLDIANAAIVRFRKWYELGFQEEFLFDVFDSLGFTPAKFPGYISHCATVYTFTMRSNIVRLSDWNSSPAITATWWDAEPEGRWTRDTSLFPLETSSSWSKLRVRCINYLPVTQVVTFTLDDFSQEMVLESGQNGDMIVPRGKERGTLRIITSPVVPASLGAPDKRALGVFMKSVEYLE